jgi:hypothetical protein
MHTPHTSRDRHGSRSAADERRCASHMGTCKSFGANHLEHFHALCFSALHTLHTFPLSTPLLLARVRKS